MFERALAGFEKALGPEDATTAYHLGLVYYFQENFSKAAAMYERALAGYEKAEAEAPENEQLLLQRLNVGFLLAGLLDDWCKLESATDQYRKVVQGYQKLRRPADPVALKALDKIKSCETRIKESGGNVPGDADGNGGNDGGGVGGYDVTGDVDGNNSGNGDGDGVLIASNRELARGRLPPIVLVLGHFYPDRISEKVKNFLSPTIRSRDHMGGNNYYNELGNYYHERG